MKRKQSNYARYRELCDEDVKQDKEVSDCKFGPEYLIMSRTSFKRKGMEYAGYLTYNTETDKFELFLRREEYLIQKTSLIEGNFWRVMDDPELIICITRRVIEGRKNETDKNKSHD